jgi:3-methyladenine DNA glycosylase AlkD
MWITYNWDWFEVGCHGWAASQWSVDWVGKEIASSKLFVQKTVNWFLSQKTKQEKIGRN